MFFINGALFANWVSRIPEFQDRFALDEGALGLTLLGISAGVITALALASGLIARFSSRVMTMMAGVALSLSLPLIALTPHPLALWISLYLFGALMSTMDVSMNAQGVEVERRIGRPVMSSFHGAWSIGGAVGAAMGAGMASLKLDPLPHFAIAAAIFLVATLVAGRGLPIEHEMGRTASGAAEPVFQIPARALWPLGAVAFCSAIGEGSMGDWSAVYLENVVRASPQTAALGYAAFQTTMTIGRFSGDWLAARLEPVRLVRIGGVIAAAGLLTAMLIPQVPVVLIGFALVGLGVANVIPLAFSAAGRMPGITSSKGIAGVATIGYAGFLAGPPFIGLIADRTSLSFALSLAALLVASIVLFAGAMRPGRTG